MIKINYPWRIWYIGKSFSQPRDSDGRFASSGGATSNKGATKKILAAPDSEWESLLDKHFPGADKKYWTKMRKNYDPNKVKSKKRRQTTDGKPRKRFNYAELAVKIPLDK